MMNSSQGLLLFSFFAGVVVFDKYIKRIKADSMPSIDACYASTIKKLFKFTFKLPSRHSTSPQFSSIELFQLRKAFYLKNSFNSEILKRAKIIHVAGTKGKGSTAEYIAAGLRYSKEFKVGVFISPHLHTARERIKIGTNLISKEDLIRLGEESIAQMETVSWATFFDMLVHLAMKYFAEQKVDYIVMEAGIGGRFDTTNFIDSSDVSVITSISLDHQALLGETVEEIAFQKAGIIKMNGNVFTSAAQDEGVLRVLNEECVKMNATLHIIPVVR
jgi:dihydrofolate synthase / folylpolyglutamate synthase